MRLSTIGLIVTLALLAASLTAAQQTAKIPRLCYLALYPVAESPIVAGQSQYDAFLHGLRDVGYVQGHSITIDYLSVDGQLDRFPTLAGDCLRLQAADAGVNPYDSAHLNCRPIRRVIIDEDDLPSCRTQGCFEPAQ